MQIFLWLWTPFSTAFFAFKAFALASALRGAGASFFAFSAIFVKTHCPFLNSPSYLFPCCFLYFFCIFFCHFLLDEATSFSKLICGTAGRKQTGKSQTTRTLGRISWGEHSPYHFTKDVIHLVPSLTTVLFGVFSFLVFHAASVLSFTSFHSLSSGPHFDPSLLFALFWHCFSASSPLPLSTTWNILEKHSDVLISKDLPAYQADTFAHVTQAQAEKSLSSGCFWDHFYALVSLGLFIFTRKALDKH